LRFIVFNYYKIKQAEASGKITNEEYIKLYMKYGDKMRNKNRRYA